LKYKFIEKLVNENYEILENLIGKDMLLKKYPNIKGDFDYYNYCWIIQVIVYERIRKLYFNMLDDLKSYMYGK